MLLSEEMPDIDVLLRPAGYELLYDTGDITPNIGELACLSNTETDNNDDFYTLGKPVDPHLGAELVVEDGIDDIYTIGV